MDQKQKILNIIKWLSALGILSALYSLYEYYWGDSDAFCNINSTFSCSAVYDSGYSGIFGIPVSLFGVLGFGAIFICAAWGMQGKNTHKWLLPMTSVFAIFSLYFIYLSAFIIKSWCVACIISWIIIWALFVLSLELRKIIKSSPQAISK